jgi:RND family efflux transporter MFP subunit
LDCRDISSPWGAGSARGALFLALLLLALFATEVEAQQDGALVRIDRVTTQPLSQTVPVLGRLVPRQAGSVSSRVEAPIEAFQVEVGDRVRAGEVIARLNPDRLAALRDRAAGRLSESRAKKSTAQAQLKLARQELGRLEGLKASAAFSQARFDDAEQNVAINQAQVAEAEAAMVTAAAELELTEIDVADTQIMAPYDGVVIQRMSEAGAYVKVGDSLVRLIADSSLEIEADVPYQRIIGLTPGATVELTLDDGSPHEASVRAIVPEENPLTRTRAVRFVPSFSQTERPLAADQSVTVWVPIGTPRTVLTVHKDAIITQGGAAMVFVTKGEVAEPREITLGEAVGSRYEVLSGLEEGDMVVVRGNERLRPGDKVRIDEAS